MIWDVTRGVDHTPHATHSVSRTKTGIKRRGLVCLPTRQQLTGGHSETVLCIDDDNMLWQRAVTMPTSPVGVRCPVAVQMTQQGSLRLYAIQTI